MTSLEKSMTLTVSLWPHLIDFDVTWKSMRSPSRLWFRLTSLWRHLEDYDVIRNSMTPPGSLLKVMSPSRLWCHLTTLWNYLEVKNAIWRLWRQQEVYDHTWQVYDVTWKSITSSDMFMMSSISLWSHFLCLCRYLAIPWHHPTNLWRQMTN